MTERGEGTPQGSVKVSLAATSVLPFWHLSPSTTHIPLPKGTYNAF
jgi:hypothetical protein